MARDNSGRKPWAQRRNRMRTREWRSVLNLIWITTATFGEAEVAAMKNRNRLRSTRCFIAIELSAETVGRALQLIRQLEAVGGSGVKWVASEHLHLTLAFLGQVGLTHVSSVCRAAARAAQQVGGFPLQCGGVGAFPELARPRTIWMGVQPSPSLGRLHAELNAALAEAGWPVESRRFHAHVTLGRVRGAIPAALPQRLAELQGFVGAVTDVDEIVVLSSRLLPGGPQYESLGHACAAGARWG